MNPIFYRFMLTAGDALCAHREGFSISRRARAIFGYLDHPFSERYQYGWKSESQRIPARADFIAHLRSAGKVMHLAGSEAHDFVRARASARLERDAGSGIAVLSRDPHLAIEHRGSVA